MDRMTFNTRRETPNYPEAHGETPDKVHKFAALYFRQEFA